MDIDHIKYYKYYIRSYTKFKLYETTKNYLSF